MAKRNGKFIGAYVDKSTKKRLEDEARKLDRPLSWLIEKILAEGVKHLLEERDGGLVARPESSLVTK